MNYGIHWKLGNIPRQDGLRLRAIADSIYGLPTISHLTRHLPRSVYGLNDFVVSRRKMRDQR